MNYHKGIKVCLLAILLSLKCNAAHDPQPNFMVYSSLGGLAILGASGLALLDYTVPFVGTTALTAWGTIRGLDAALMGDVTGVFASAAYLGGGLGIQYGFTLLGGVANPVVLPALLAYGAGNVALSFILATGRKLHNKLSAAQEAREAVQTQKNTCEVTLATADMCPTTQMRRNAVIQWMMALEREKDKTPEINNTMQALKSIKNDLETLPLLKRIRELQEEFGFKTSGFDIDTLKNKRDVAITEKNYIDKEAYREMIIDEYIRILSSSDNEDVLRRYFNFDNLYNLMKTEIELLTNKDINKNALDNLATHLDYVAFKAFLKSRMPDRSLLSFWYFYGYYKVKNNLEALNKWMSERARDSFYDKDTLDKTIVDVNAAVEKSKQSQVISKSERAESLQRSQRFQQHKQGIMGSISGTEDKVAALRNIIQTSTDDLQKQAANAVLQEEVARQKQLQEEELARQKAQSSSLWQWLKSFRGK